MLNFQRIEVLVLLSDDIFVLVLESVYELFFLWLESGYGEIFLSDEIGDEAVFLCDYALLSAPMLISQLGE